MLALKIFLSLSIFLNPSVSGFNSFTIPTTERELSRFTNDDITYMLVPDIKILSPGLSFTINNTQYILSLKVSFNVNKMFGTDGLENGQSNILARKTDNYIVTNTPLTCRDFTTKLQSGDNVYYWMAAEDNNMCRFLKQGQSFMVVKDEHGELIAKNTTLEDLPDKGGESY